MAAHKGLAIRGLEGLLARDILFGLPKGQILWNGDSAEGAVARRLTSLKNFLEEVRKSGAREVEVTSRVVTTTPPGGERVVYRGRVVARARLAGEVLEYVEVVRPVAHASGAVGPTMQQEGRKLPRDASAQHRRLAQQLRYYRESFEWRLNEARERLVGECAGAGLTIRGGEEPPATTEQTESPKRELAGLRRLVDSQTPPCPTAKPPAPAATGECPGVRPSLKREVLPNTHREQDRKGCEG